jgi:GNAT superfamily N-acetyltransferase
MVVQANSSNNGVAGEIHLRKATAADFHSIREVARLSRLGALSHFMTEEEVEAEVEQYYNDDVLNGVLANPANAIYVVEKGPLMIGHGSVLPEDRRGRPRLLQFYVRPGFQRHGVGQMLFDRAKDHLREAGAKEMYISTLGDNEVGRAFLEKHDCRLLQVYDKIWNGETHSVAFYYLPL